MALNKGLVVLGLGVIAGYLYLKKEGGLAGVATKATVGEGGFFGLFGEDDEPPSNHAVNVEVAAGGGKQIRMTDPEEFQQVDREGWFGNDYYITVQLVNGTPNPWKGVLSCMTVEDVGQDAPVTTNFDFGDFEVPTNTTVEKRLLLHFHGYHVNLGATAVTATVKLGTVSQSFSYNVD